MVQFGDFREGTGFMNLGNDADSEITGISCHMNYDLCVVSTISSGLGVIGQAHNVSWIRGQKQILGLMSIVQMSL